MNMTGQASAQSVHRARILRELGITPWVRRTLPAAPGTPQIESPTPTAAVACMVILPSGCTPRELDLLGRALSAGGAILARAARVMVREGRLDAYVPEARAYLVLGQAQAHALGRELSAAVMQQAQIVLADEPAQLLCDGAAKRRLWSALRSLRRVLAMAQA